MGSSICEMEGSMVHDSFAALVASGAEFPLARQSTGQLEQDQLQLVSDVSTTYEPTNIIVVRNFNQDCDTLPAEESRLPLFSTHHYKHERVPDQKPKRLVFMRLHQKQWKGRGALTRIAAISDARKPLIEQALSLQTWRYSGVRRPPPSSRRTPNKLRKRRRPDGYEE